MCLAAFSRACTFLHSATSSVKVYGGGRGGLAHPESLDCGTGIRAEKDRLVYVASLTVELQRIRPPGSVKRQRPVEPSCTSREGGREGGGCSLWDCTGCELQPGGRALSGPWRRGAAPCSVPSRHRPAAPGCTARRSPCPTPLRAGRDAGRGCRRPQASLGAAKVHRRPRSGPPGQSISSRWSPPVTCRPPLRARALSPPLSAFWLTSSFVLCCPPCASSLKDPFALPATRRQRMRCPGPRLLETSWRHRPAPFTSTNRISTNSAITRSGRRRAAERCKGSIFPTHRASPLCSPPPPRAWPALPGPLPAGVLLPSSSPPPCCAWLSVNTGGH